MYSAFTGFTYSPNEFCSELCSNLYIRECFDKHCLILMAWLHTFSNIQRRSTNKIVITYNGQCNRWHNTGISDKTVRPCISELDRVRPYLTMYDSYLNRTGRMAIVRKHMCTLICIRESGLHVRACMSAYTIIHGHDIRTSLCLSFKNRTRLSWVHSSGTRIRPRLVRLYERITRVANRVGRVFCVR